MDRQNVYLRFIKAARMALKILMDRFGDEIVAAYIYGSIARGDYTESSDIDIHIIIKHKELMNNIPRNLWIEDLKVDISPHHISFYKLTPQWILDHINTTCRWEGLWELENIIILYDPENLVSNFREKILPILSNDKLIRARAKVSFNEALKQLSNVENLIERNLIDRAITSMYMLRGGGGPSGAVPNILKTIIKLSCIQLTVRRIWIKFRRACHKLRSRELLDYIKECYELSKIDLKTINEALSLVNQFSNSIGVDERELKRFKMTVQEFINEEEMEAAYIFMIGSITSKYDALINTIPRTLRFEAKNILLKIAGISNHEDLTQRIKSLYKAIKIVNELFEN